MNFFYFMKYIILEYVYSIFLENWNLLVFSIYLTKYCVGNFFFKKYLNLRGVNDLTSKKKNGKRFRLL